MSDYIEREAALDTVKRTSGDYAAAWAEIAHMPTVDAVPVVRCKDCKHSISCVDKSGAIAYVVCNLDEYSDGVELRTPMDYCSYGEREEANT